MNFHDGSLDFIVLSDFNHALIAAVDHDEINIQNIYIINSNICRFYD